MPSVGSRQGSGQEPGQKPLASGKLTPTQQQVWATPAPQRAIAPRLVWAGKVARVMVGLTVGLTAGLTAGGAQAQDERFAPAPLCPRPVPLMPVGGDDPEVVKRVSPPGVLINRSNWNTDFIVPGNLFFPMFRVNLFFKGGNNYRIQMNLKYADGTADEFYSDRLNVEADQLVQIPAYPRRRPDGLVIAPYQVNVRVGNLGAMGSTYVLSVEGCR